MNDNYTNNTWADRVLMTDAAGLLKALRAAGLPLANGEPTELSERLISETSVSENEHSNIVCLAEIIDTRIKWIIAIPSGGVFRFEPETLDKEFLNFAVRNYYLVTGNMADRKMIASMMNIQQPEAFPKKKSDWQPEYQIEPGQIKGKCVSRVKTDALSGMTLDQILASLGYQPEPPRQRRFF